MWSLHAPSAQLATLQLMHWTCAVSVPISGSEHSNSFRLWRLQALLRRSGNGCRPP